MGGIAVKVVRILLATLLVRLVRLFLLPETARADVVAVSPGQSINAAIQAANPGDTVLVQPGSYQEAIQLKGGVILRGQAGANATRLLPLPGQPVVTVMGA